MLRHSPWALAVLLAQPPAAGAQALYIPQGERAAELSAGWSVGPFSQGLELVGGASLDGRWEGGVGLSWYRADFGGPGDDAVFEWSVAGRYFFLKERDDGTPVSLAAHVQYFRHDIGDGDDGWLVQGGGQLFKTLSLRDTLALHPFIGFAVAGESATFGGRSDRSLSLTRQFGMHVQWTLRETVWIRVTVEEQSFRRETFRALRAAFMRRF